MNDGSSREAEIARFIAKIVGARQTTNDELPDVVASIRDSLVQLSGGSAAVAPAGETAQPAEAKPVRRQSVAAPARRPREAPDASAESPPVAVAAPRLMRRAEVAPPGPSQLELDALRPAQNTPLRGIVRWFDPRTRRGSLRLPGHGDVSLEGAALEASGITRLYKGQEIDATVESENGLARLLTIALPGRQPEASGVLGGAGGARRHAKPVVVEMKRDAMRRAAARIEAELVLGNLGDRNS